MSATGGGYGKRAAPPKADRRETFLKGYFILVIDIHIFDTVLFGEGEDACVVCDDGLHRAIAVIQTILYDTCIALDIVKVTTDVGFAHHQAVILYAAAVFFGEILFPIERNVASLHNEVLLVFDGGFDDFAYDRPQIGGELVIVTQRGEFCVAAADEAHF